MTCLHQELDYLLYILGPDVLAEVLVPVIRCSARERTWWSIMLAVHLNLQTTGAPYISTATRLKWF